MKQTIIWLASALLLATSATLSMTVGTFRSAATIEAAQSDVTATATPAQRETAMAPLDDVVLTPAIEPKAPPREMIDPDASLAPRAADLTVVPSPPVAAMTATNASQPRQDAKPDVKLIEPGAQPTRKPNGSRAEPPGRRVKQTARACASPPSNRFAQLLQRLNRSPRCPAKRTAA